MSNPKKLKLTNQDLKDLENNGIEENDLLKQIENLTKGFPYSKLSAPCTLENGLKKIGSKLGKLVNKYEDFAPELKIVKFVPASGAASRMFKHLYYFLENPQEKNGNKIKEFINSLHLFPFSKSLEAVIEKNGLDFKTIIKNKDYKSIIYNLLSEEGLNYGKLPKALITFHHDRQLGERTPIDEHLEEGAFYAKGKNGEVNIHFTVSPEHKTSIEAYVNQIKVKFEKKYNVFYNISYSLQQSNTDTIAIDENKNLVRNEDSSILFRPSGHGALLSNLQNLEADIIFIKNIDNVVPGYKHASTFKNKQAMGALLVEIKNKIHKFLTLLNESSIIESDIDEMIEFTKNELIISINKEEARQNPRSYLNRILNRPIRVCGMVRNEGDPGGGPFWVENENSEISLQIVESSQINLKDNDQQNIFANSTHFNPVDIVCTINDYKGNKFDLQNFVDQSTGLISEKSKNGKPFKALELPGLWNGSMANWISIFVEVPIETFNPVKTVNDLLKPMHK